VQQDSSPFSRTTRNLAGRKFLLAGRPEIEQDAEKTFSGAKKTIRAAKNLARRVGTGVCKKLTFLNKQCLWHGLQIRASEEAIYKVMGKFEISRKVVTL